MIFFFITALLVLYQNVYTVSVLKDTTVVIPFGSSIKSISIILKKDDIIRSKKAFQLIYCIQQIFTANYPKAGEYNISRDATMLNIIEIMNKGKVKQYPITIIGGQTVKQIVTFVEQRICDSQISTKNSKRYANIKEGSLLPETYYYTASTNSKKIIERMGEAQEKYIKHAWYYRDKSIDNILTNPRDVIILASIVEKEANFQEEKRLIAGIYLNRLKSNMRLQADPTVIYGIIQSNDQFNGRLSYQDLLHKSPYNTYRNNGLPPTAICNPSKSSIDSVLHPIWTHNLYFVANGKGGHIFSQTFTEHKKNITLVRKNNTRS